MVELEEALIDGHQINVDPLSTSQVIYFFGQTVSSYILAFIVSVMFEAPVVTMLKILSPSRKKRV